MFSMVRTQRQNISSASAEIQTLGYYDTNFNCVFVNLMQKPNIERHLSCIDITLNQKSLGVNFKFNIATKQNICIKSGSGSWNYVLQELNNLGKNVKNDRDVEARVAETLAFILQYHAHLHSEKNYQNMKRTLSFKEFQGHLLQ